MTLPQNSLDRPQSRLISKLLRVGLVILVVSQILCSVMLLIYYIHVWRDPAFDPSFLVQFNKYPKWSTLSTVDILIGILLVPICGWGILKRQRWAAATYAVWLILSLLFNAFNPHGVELFRFPALTPLVFISLYYFAYSLWERKQGIDGDRAVQPVSGPLPGGHGVIMQTNESTKPENELGGAPFILGGLSFIPLIGVLFGVICILWGLFTKKVGGKKLAAIGSAGIAFTILLYGAIFYFGFLQRGGVYDHLRTKLAQSTIDQLVPAIEMYKLQFGHYPETLKKLKESLPKNSFVSIYDPSDLKIGTPRKFYYERVGDDHYYLRGLGPDGVPFTKDDLTPQIPAARRGKLGLLTARQAQP